MSPSAGRITLAKELGGLPHCLYATYRFSGKVVGPDEEWVVVQSLGTRRLIIRIIQTHKGVSQEGSELTASLFELCEFAIHLAGELREFQMPRPIFTSGEREFSDLP